METITIGIFFIFEDIKSQWGDIDFVVHAVAFSDKSELSGEYLNNRIRLASNGVKHGLYEIYCHGHSNDSSHE